MLCLSKPAYYKPVDNILEALEDEARADMRRAGERLRQQILEENPEKDHDDTLDAVVSCDGIWAKRVFTSLTGVVLVISVDNDELLDYHVLSKACQKCAVKKGKDLRCGHWNMNVTLTLLVARQQWSLKELKKRHNPRYRWMVSDGDSKAFNSVENVYGEIKVDKLDCAGHVQRRISKHLLNLKARTNGKLADGRPIGGTGRLYETKIKKLEKDYGLGIRQNTVRKSNPARREVGVAVYALKNKNIIAILHHNVKFDDLAKQHHFCPPGE